MTIKKNPSTATAETEGVARDESYKIKCGLIMPISKSQGLEPEHWLNVKGIICEALADTEFDVRLVSESDDVGVIHKSIVQNIYKNDIVICDVSTHNANVMFELGLRLAFDKPTVIIKDDETPFSFDTQVIEHIVYKRSLHYVDIVSFKKKLKDKVLATLEQSRQPDFSTFLGHFTINHVSRIEERTVTINDALVERLDQMQRAINGISRQQSQLYSRERDGIPEYNVKSQVVLSYPRVQAYVRQCLAEQAASNNMSQGVYANFLSSLPKEDIDHIVEDVIKSIKKITPNRILLSSDLVREEVMAYIVEMKI
ncbi:hypothetical protein SJR90_08370 [Aeromonas caviae]|uniref:hypothetical protein n=1 Tax=Aeromonas caviae TaxID=648 RepID=UPI0029DBA4E0|nr:hypothetical protein [Aeromonas caviae]MDX7782356.1 hypothetical protein [Aeromonas caviae]